MPTDSAFSVLGDEPFLSLTTFRKTGEPISTPVWIARDGDALIVTTPESSGKVKRLRNSPRIEIRPCNRTGRVKDDAESVAGVAIILSDNASKERSIGIISKKYGLEYKIVMWIERLVKSGLRNRVILRITPA